LHLLISNFCTVNFISHFTKTSSWQPVSYQYLYGRDIVFSMAIALYHINFKQHIVLSASTFYLCLSPHTPRLGLT
jgi:hypothetical protein